jgi:hypothetical protein
MLARVLPIVLLLLLVPAAGAQAATVKVPVPAEGQVAVTVASVAKKKVALKVAQAPAALAVTGAAKRGRLAIAVIRPRGTYGAGSVAVKLRGGRAKGAKRFVAALDGGSAGAACKTLGTLLGKPLRTGGLAAGDVRAVGAAAAARLCGKPVPEAAAGVLARLGLGAPVAGGGGSLDPGGSQTPPPAPGGGGSANQCANGVDDDGDGQIDAAGERALRPDPGCMNANDPSEAGEVPVPAGCNAGAGVGDEPSRLNVGINAGCGSFTEVAVYAAPNAFVCDIQASAGAWNCVIANGQAYAETRTTAADEADLQIGLNGAVNCAVPATIVLYRPDLSVAELVTPV